MTQASNTLENIVRSCVSFPLQRPILGKKHVQSWKIPSWERYEKRALIICDLGMRLKFTWEKIFFDHASYYFVFFFSREFCGLYLSCVRAKFAFWFEIFFHYLKC